MASTPISVTTSKVDDPAEQALVDMYLSSFAGPVPPPDLLAGYEATCEGAADRIIKMAELSLQKRLAMQEKELDAIIANRQAGRQEARWGQWLGFAISVIAIVVAGYCATHGAQATGSIIGGATLVSLATAFILGRRKPGPLPPPEKTPKQPKGNPENN